MLNDKASTGIYNDPTPQHSNALPSALLIRIAQGLGKNKDHLFAKVPPKLRRIKLQKKGI